MPRRRCAACFTLWARGVGGLLSGGLRRSGYMLPPLRGWRTLARSRPTLRVGARRDLSRRARCLRIGVGDASQSVCDCAAARLVSRCGPEVLGACFPGAEWDKTRRGGDKARQKALAEPVALEVVGLAELDSPYGSCPSPARDQRCASVPVATSPKGRGVFKLPCDGGTCRGCR